MSFLLQTWLNSEGKSNKALEELLDTKSSIDPHRWRAIWKLGMELCWNKSETAESIKEARAICSHVTMDTEALCFSNVKEAKVTCIQTIKETKTTHTCTIQEAEPPSLLPSGMLRPRGPSRLSHSTGNMPKPSKTWRNKSSERKAEAKLTSSLPIKWAYMPPQQSSEAHWWLPIIF